ncbi:hypothetical protein ACJX0J_015914 [Zea mays]
MGTGLFWETILIHLAVRENFCFFRNLCSHIFLSGLLMYSPSHSLFTLAVAFVNLRWMHAFCFGLSSGQLTHVKGLVALATVVGDKQELEHAIWILGGVFLPKYLWGKIYCELGIRAKNGSPASWLDGISGNSNFMISSWIKHKEKNTSNNRLYPTFEKLDMFLVSPDRDLMF